MKPNAALKLGVALLVPQVAGLIGALFTVPAIPGWYTNLVKPSLAPPNWIFAPVWTSLFILIGIAAFLVWQRGLERKDVKVALGVFLGQLILNILWSVLFFGLRSPGLALAEIIVFWLAILATKLAFRKVSRIAAWLLLPYLLWVGFATYLNYSIWLLN